MRRSEAEALAQAERKKHNIEIFKSVLFGTCLFYTFISMIILATQLFSKSDMIDPFRFFMILPFSACIAVANLVLKSKLKTFPKLCIHFVAIVASFYAFMCAPIKNGNVLALIALFAFLYIIVASVILIVKRAHSKKTEIKPEYVSMFSDASKNSK